MFMGKVTQQSYKDNVLQIINLIHFLNIESAW